jgi:IclR family transcriptional regulator, acetate operon repressor
MADPSRVLPAAEERVVGADRVLAILRELAGHAEAVSLDRLSGATRSSKPTTHRALAALCRAGFARRTEHGRYALGDDFVRLAFAHHEARPDTARMEPILRALTAEVGETTHYAVLDGREVVYRAKIDPPGGAIKLTASVGGRNPAHSTAVGKLLLAHALRTDAEVRAWVRTGGLPARTDRTITRSAAFVRELATIRARGYATDDEENETGVACVAVPVWLGSPATPSGAVSISALAYRRPLASLIQALPTVKTIIGEPGTSGLHT